MQALMITAFIGGPLALAGLLGVSAQRTGRLGRELPYLVALSAIWIGVLVLLGKELRSPPGTLAALPLSRADLEFLLRHGGRLVAFIAVGFFYLRHRRLYRAMSSLGRVSPPATIPAIVCVGIAQLVAMAFANFFGMKSSVP